MAEKINKDNLVITIEDYNGINCYVSRTKDGRFINRSQVGVICKDIEDYKAYVLESCYL